MIYLGLKGQLMLKRLAEKEKNMFILAYNRYSMFIKTGKLVINCSHHQSAITEKKSSVGLMKE